MNPTSGEMFLAFAESGTSRFAFGPRNLITKRFLRAYTRDSSKTDQSSLFFSPTRQQLPTVEPATSRIQTPQGRRVSNMLHDRLKRARHNFLRYAAHKSGHGTPFMDRDYGPITGRLDLRSLDSHGTTFESLSLVHGSIKSHCYSPR